MQLNSQSYSKQLRLQMYYVYYACEKLGLSFTEEIFISM